MLAINNENMLRSRIKGRCEHDEMLSKQNYGFRKGYSIGSPLLKKDWFLIFRNGLMKHFLTRKVI